MRPRIAFINTGGTIDCLGKDRLDHAWYLESGQRVAPGSLLRQIPEIGDVADIHEVPFERVPSHALTDHDLIQLVDLIHADISDNDTNGIVIAHGTNTMEETAYFLNLTLKTHRPVVLTGSMRPNNALGFDGNINLHNAVCVAADNSSAGRGCLIVMNNAILSARDAIKTATYRVNAFQSRDVGPLGFSDSDGKVVYYHAPARPHTLESAFDISDVLSLPRVDVVLSYIGADGELIKAAYDAGAKGIVSAATGAGCPTPAQDAAFDKYFGQKDRIMCLCSRLASGRVSQGSGLRKRGFVAADNLPPWKARILLALSLSRTDDADRIQRWFDNY